MKKLFSILTLLVLALGLLGCEDKKVANYIPEGEYDFVKRISADGTILTRDDYEENEFYTDGIVINIWSNNEAKLGQVIDNKIQKTDVIVTDEYFINSENKEDQVKYKYSDNKIELHYNIGSKDIYVKNYRKDLEARYKEMIGHYEIVSWINGDGIENVDEDLLTKETVKELKKNTYIEVLENKKIEMSLYFNNGGTTAFKKYDFTYRMDEKYFYSSGEKFPYTYENDKITLILKSDGKTATMIFQKTK